jgi:hypothetical protein
MGDEQTTASTETAPVTAEQPETKDAPKKAAKKSTKKTTKKAAKKAGKKTAKAGKGDDVPLWQKMGWNKPGRKRGKKAAKKAAKAPKATPAVKKALARTGTAVTAGSDVRSLLVAAIKRAVDTADYENARQILGLLEKQKR